MEGILPVYKSVGITSYDVVRACKRKLKQLGFKKVKIGHGGTLDPFAEGILLVLVGRSNTKKMNELSALPKTYIAEAVLGASSDTLDCTGSIASGNLDLAKDDLEKKIKKVKGNFVGTIEQKIPDYSAAKIDGVPRYKLARNNVDLPNKVKPVTIYSLDISFLSNEKVELSTTVSSGTYIRQLSYDIFYSIGVPSYLSKLKRTQIGQYSINDCISYEDIMTKDWEDYLK